jgi:hypothetical protein
MVDEPLQAACQQFQIFRAVRRFLHPNGAAAVACRMIQTPND